MATKDHILHGVVLFTGPVDFAGGSDWVGIRLTTGSHGLGKNDGSVGERKYFEAGGEKNGVFVRATQVKARQGMTRLDEVSGSELQRSCQW